MCHSLLKKGAVATPKEEEIEELPHVCEVLNCEISSTRKCGNCGMWFCETHFGARSHWECRYCQQPLIHRLAELQKIANFLVEALTTPTISLSSDKEGKENGQAQKTSSRETST
jgi:hypothetical protein